MEERDNSYTSTDFPNKIKVSLRDLDRDFESSGRFVGILHDGIMIESRKPFCLGDRVEVWIMIDQETPFLNCFGQILWIKKMSSYLFKVGIKIQCFPAASIGSPA